MTDKLDQVAETPANEPQLEIVDIVNAAKIIKAAIERGVFQAEEMSGVAGVYDKFAAFVGHLEAQASEERAGDEAGEE